MNAEHRYGLHACRAAFNSEADGIARAYKFHQSCRGSGDGMQAKRTIRNTGSPSGDRSMDQRAARERQAGPTGMTERLVVLMKPGSCEKTHPAKRRSTVLIFIPGAQRSGSPRVPAYSIRESHYGCPAEPNPLLQVEGETHPQHFHSDLAQTPHMKLTQSQLTFNPIMHECQSHLRNGRSARLGTSSGTGLCLLNMTVL